jgi:peptidoglycan/xylan/chitin deacetylase (PgdA/CDA1 family)
MSEALELTSESTIRDVIDTDPFVSVATWAEQIEAVDAGATIGSHTVDHHRLTAISHSDVDRQLVESKREIEEKLGRDCEFFCYPNGSLDEFTLERVKNAGYRAAVTTVHGLNKTGDDLFTLKRYPMPRSEDLQKNLLRLSGIFESRFVSALLGKR